MHQMEQRSYTKSVYPIETAVIKITPLEIEQNNCKTRNKLKK